MAQPEYFPFGPIADPGSAQLYEFHDQACRLRPDEFAQGAPS
jgi:hypothetical protein